jgi:hypothetical protein
MLKPLLTGFAALHYQDALTAVALSSAAAFLWDWRVPAVNAFHQMSARQCGVWWGVWAVGVALAAVGRALASAEPRRVRLLPASDTFARQFIVAAVYFLALAWYAERIEDPAHGGATFPVGALLSWALVLVALLVVEAVENMIGVAGREYVPGVSENITSAVVTTAVVAFDLVVWLDGWLIVVILGGAMFAYLGVGVGLRWVFGAEEITRPVARPLLSHRWRAVTPSTQ